jgi:hypothetical protein
LGRTSWWWELVEEVHIIVDRKQREGYRQEPGQDTPPVAYFLQRPPLPFLPPLNNNAVIL